MTTILRYSLTILFLATMSNTFAYSNTVNPPDSTTNIVDKTAATYIIEEGKTMFGIGRIKDASLII